jgi:fimbrial chaperone protein
MRTSSPSRFLPERRAFTATALVLMLAALPCAAPAGEFSISPIRVDLKPGAMNETITVNNEAPTRLRVSMKLMEWSQDASGQDVYKDSSDLIYFPRQMELEPHSRRLLRVGLKSAATTVERTYRLFIEESPEPAASGARAQVAIYFRFGVPIFVTPAGARPMPEVLEPTLSRGKLALKVRNNGNQHFRLTKLTISDGQGYSQEVQGWYSLAGTERTYTADIPRDACRKAKAFRVEVEGENLRLERSVDVEPASCP